MANQSLPNLDCTLVDTRLINMGSCPNYSFARQLTVLNPGFDGRYEEKPDTGTSL